jgi:hypothetical protein
LKIFQSDSNSLQTVDLPTSHSALYEEDESRDLHHSPTTVISVASLTKSVEQMKSHSTCSNNITTNSTTNSTANSSSMNSTTNSGYGGRSFVESFRAGYRLPELRQDEKVLHCAWHPSNNNIAVAGVAGLCFYNA